MVSNCQGTSTFYLVKVKKEKCVEMKKKSSKVVEKRKAFVPFVNAYAVKVMRMAQSHG